MFVLFKILAFIAIFCSIEACNSSQNNKCTDGSDCTNGKRSVRSAQIKLQDALAQFDVKLTAALADEIKEMSDAEKQQFSEDIKSMNKAVLLAAKSIGKNNRGPDSTIQTRQEFVRALADKVFVDFKDRKWYKRLQEIGGDQIGELEAELTENI